MNRREFIEAATSLAVIGSASWYSVYRWAAGQESGTVESANIVLTLVDKNEQILALGSVFFAPAQFGAITGHTILQTIATGTACKCYLTIAGGAKIGELPCVDYRPDCATNVLTMSTSHLREGDRIHVEGLELGAA